MATPIYESVHEAAGSYQVGTGLFLMRLKRRVLGQLVEEWLADANDNHDHLLALAALTHRDINLTDNFVGASHEIPGEDRHFIINERQHKAVLEDELLSILERENAPPAPLISAFGDGASPRAIARTLASARSDQLRSYLRGLRHQLRELETTLLLGPGHDNDGARRLALRRFLDGLYSPFFFLSWRHNDITWLTTWIPTAPLHHALFRTSEHASRPDGIVLYPTLNSIPDDADDRDDLSRHLPLLRQTVGGRSAPFGLVQELQPKRQSGTRWRRNLVRVLSPAAISDLHFLNVSSLSVALSDASVETPEDPDGIGGVLHMCAPLTRTPPYWLAPQLRLLETGKVPDAVQLAGGERLSENWNALGGRTFIEGMRRGLEHLLAEPSDRISSEISRDKDERVQSQITTAHSIKGMASDLLVFADWARDALDAMDDARSLEEVQRLADVARARLDFVYAEIALIAGTSRYAHAITRDLQDGQLRIHLPAHEPERVVEGVLHLYLLLLRERLWCEPFVEQRARVNLIGTAEARHAETLATIRSETGALNAYDDEDWRDIFFGALGYDPCRPIFLGLSETIRNIRRVGQTPKDDHAEIRIDCQRVKHTRGARLSYVLSQYQSGLDSAAIAAFDGSALPSGLKTHNTKYGRAGFCILEVELAPPDVVAALCLEQSDPAVGELRYHLLLHFGVDPEIEVDHDA